MKTGIIIVFHNYENEIDIDFFKSYCRELKHIEFCLVNNDSKDDTYLILKDLKEHFKNVSVVNIKRFKSDISAVKCGARYMFNAFKLKHLGYVNANSLNTRHHGLNTVMVMINEYQDEIIRYDKKILRDQNKKQTLFQKLFSVVDYLKKIELEKQVDNLHYQSKF
ncbi:glycosyltransferase [Psychroserpens algicola]|uniref:Glycosyltransferase n=1 Tax=Psychroserpens algicola TaxID=1719034 RepID=A0ABT0H4M5_9FLAO|nr:glycosyltransferase [Psychroserpens algicola]MCK8479343.1 glycosyltransferase [Psychroserpens algicola]